MTSILIRNANLATMTNDRIGHLPNHALITQNQRIAWIGPDSEVPTKTNPTEEINAQGAWLLPGFIDCHTHLIYAGCRAHEFEARLEGKSYQAICAEGGGILSTVNATRSATEAQLTEEATKRAQDFIAQGVTTLDIKSGYGLTLESELKMLRVAQKLGETLLLRITKGLLAAHTLPPEFTSKDDYIDHIIAVILPEVVKENLAEYVDCFTESVGFTPEQTRRLFQAARDNNLPIRLHADQLSNLEGAGIAAEFHALSADHVEYTSESSVKKMAQSGTVAVLLPTAFYYLRETQLPPIQTFRDHGVPMAVSTDCNPGTSPSTNFLLALNMASTLFGLTPTESLLGGTINAARALGLQNEIGTLEVGKSADLALWAIDHPSQLVARLQSPPLLQSWSSGNRGLPQQCSSI
ncbi:imidazolonepropionase [Armatimonadetes bacterium Uphvl-Ar1]|nr:imidazolonepropionase [Armatimonadetes bacterium Uphvl-Ar1]